jgi:hypothetical protein
MSARFLSSLFSSIPNPHLQERIEQIRPLILWGFERPFFEGFCNVVDKAVGIVENLPGADRYPTLDEEVVLVLA